MNWKIFAIAPLLIGSLSGNISLHAQDSAPSPRRSLARTRTMITSTTHPLFDALEQGFCSVEADIHLVDGKLLVAHDLKDVDRQTGLCNRFTWSRCGSASNKTAGIFIRTGRSACC